MSLLRAVNHDRNIALAVRVRSARTFKDRAIGLLGTSRLPTGEGLWISPCRSIHTVFMRYPIDVLFLNRQGVVLACRTVAPWRLTGWHASSDGVLELPAGTLDRTGTRVGDRIQLTENQ